MFVSIPWLIFGAALLLLVGIFLGSCNRLGADADSAQPPKDIWNDGFWYGYQAAQDEQLRQLVNPASPPLVGEEQD